MAPAVWVRAHLPHRGVEGHTRVRALARHGLPGDVRRVERARVRAQLQPRLLHQGHERAHGRGRGLHEERGHHVHWFSAEPGLHLHVE